MKDVKVFLQEASKEQIWVEVHKRIIGTALDYIGVKAWVMYWLERRDKREGYYSDLIRLLRRSDGCKAKGSPNITDAS